MNAARFVLGSLLCASLTTVEPSARAFGGTAREFEHEGNFVVTNNAAFAFRQQLNSPTSTAFALRPALDYFIIDRLSIGAAIELDFNSPPGNAPNTTTFIVAPDVGYELALSDTWSFWPQASLSFAIASRSSATLTLVLLAPFLVHPAEHFFFGLGPGFSQDLTSNPNTSVTGNFVIGGYFDH